MKKSELKNLIETIVRATLKEGMLYEKHGKIPNLELYMSLTDPDANLSQSQYDKIDKIEKEASRLGLLDDLISAASKRHWGRYDFTSGNTGMDLLKWRQNWIKDTQNRITKGGKLNKNSATWLKNQIKSDRA